MKLDSIAPGQTIRCTLQRDVRIKDDADTVMRLMRLDPEIKKALKSAQEHRVQTLLIRSRGKRPWEVRAKSGKIVRPLKGESWTMRWFPHVKADFAAVEHYLAIEPASK